MLLGFIAGVTILLGLPVGRLQNPRRGLRVFLNACAVGVLLFYTLSETLRRYRANRLLRRAAHTAVGLFAVQIVIGGINVLTQFTPFWNALHLAAATAVWGAMFVFALIGMRVLGGSTAPVQTTPGVNPNAQPYPPPASGR